MNGWFETKGAQKNISLRHFTQLFCETHSYTHSLPNVYHAYFYPEYTELYLQDRKPRLVVSCIAKICTSTEWAFELHEVKNINQGY